MEPYNRPYVDPETEPGDKGTEEWADETPEQAAKRAADSVPVEERPVLRADEVKPKKILRTD